MSTFAELLATLPTVDHLEAIELRLEGSNDAPLRIENKPGQAGSLRVYHALWRKFGTIDANAANEGMRLYAEHTTDAYDHPGKHPNIDRLFVIVREQQRYDVTPITR